MNSRFVAALLAAILMLTAVDTKAQEAPGSPVAIVIHGGAGTILRENMPPEREREYRAKLTEALKAGHAILREGGSSIDAVTRAITMLEDSPLFNAGVGAVLTNIGTVEHDASIMDGRTLQAGASAATRHVRNPILLARLVLEESPHVLLVGDGAEEFAREHGLELVDNEFFLTDRRREQLQRQQQPTEEADREPAGQSRTGQSEPPQSEAEPDAPGEPEHSDPGSYGTVGAVALDADGNLAAATSTGGISNKRWGRVGDSPIIGGGTYADNRSCAVSSTGQGEYFIRGVIAYDICAKMHFTAITLDQAANTVIHEKLTGMGGTGGVIALDRDGNIATPFNTSGMYRGYIDTNGELSVEIYRD